MARVDITSPAPRQVWREVFSEDPYALPYQTPQWTDAACEADSYVDASRAYVWPDGHRIIVPMVRRHRMPVRLSAHASLPDAWGVGGALMSPGAGVEHLAYVFEDLARMPALHVRIRPSAQRAAEWTSARPTKARATDRNVHILDLEGGFDRVWNDRFTSKTRSGVRKAERSGVRVEHGIGTELINDFHRVLGSSVTRWAGQQHEPERLAQWRFQRRDPLEKFVVIAKHMREWCRIWVAYLDEEPIASSMRLVVPGGNANASRSAMIKDLAAPVRANDLLQSRAIEDACRAGCRFFVLGESGRSAGLAQYKERFGGIAHPYQEYGIDPVGIKRAQMVVRKAVKATIGFKDDDQS